MVGPGGGDESPVGVEARRLREQLDTESLPTDFSARCVRFLRLFRDNPDACSAAVIHPLGFAVFRWDFSKVEALRVHVWSDFTSQEDGSVDARHDHKWRLRSYVLVGRLTDHILGVEPVTSDSNADGEDVFEIAEVIQRNETDVVVPTGDRVRIIERRTHAVSAGEFYTVPPGALHWTEAAHVRPIATVVSAVVEEELVPRTLIPPGTGGRPLTARQTIPSGLRRRIVDVVLNAAA